MTRERSIIAVVEQSETVFGRVILLQKQKWVIILALRRDLMSCYQVLSLYLVLIFILNK